MKITSVHTNYTTKKQEACCENKIRTTYMLAVDADNFILDGGIKWGIRTDPTMGVKSNLGKPVTGSPEARFPNPPMLPCINLIY